MKKFYLLLYYLLIKNLPNSTFPGGVIFNKLRVLVIKKIFKTGFNITFQRNVYFGNGENIIIGNNCQINDNIRLNNVKIGNHVMIARDCVFLGKSHEFNDIKTPMNEQPIKVFRQTIVENDVWIGIRVVIMPGVVIKRGSVIAAGSILNISTIQNGVYGGAPAKLIKIRGDK